MPKRKSNENVKNQLKTLRSIEKNMAQLERQRERLEVQLVKEAGGPKSAMRHRHTRKGLSDYAYRRFRRRRFVYYLVTSIGVIFLWVGLWNLVDRHNLNPYLLIGSGVIIIWLTRNYK